MQIFTLVTGVIYIVLEIRQKNSMWIVGILTSLAAMWVFFRQGLYASFALNGYYLVTAFIGLWQWRRYRDRLPASDGQEGAIHLNRISVKVVLASALVAVAGVFAVAELMKVFENPMSYMDAAVTVLSAIATWWLVRSYLEQWLLWIVADLLLTLMCAMQGMWWMTALYAAYTLAAVYGYMHWKRHGYMI